MEEAIIGGIVATVVGGLLLAAILAGGKALRTRREASERVGLRQRIREVFCNHEFRPINEDAAERRIFRVSTLGDEQCVKCDAMRWSN
jgi:hypothetical protein